MSTNPSITGVKYFILLPKRGSKESLAVMQGFFYGIHFIESLKAPYPQVNSKRAHFSTQYL